MALELSMEEFDESLEYPNSDCPDPVLPRPDSIYFKKFHFLEDALSNREYQLQLQQVAHREAIAMQDSPSEQTSMHHSSHRDLQGREAETTSGQPKAKQQFVRKV